MRVKITIRVERERQEEATSLARSLGRGKLLASEEGTSINDFSGEGGRGYANSNQRKGDCVDLILTRGEGANNPKNLADVVHGRPPTFRVRPSFRLRQPLCWEADASPHLASLGKQAHVLFPSGEPSQRGLARAA